MPVHLFSASTDNAGAFVDQTVDPVDPGSVIADLACRDLGRVGGGKDEGLHAGARAIGGGRRSGIARGGHGKPALAKGPGHGHRHGHAAGLERTCG